MFGSRMGQHIPDSDPPNGQSPYTDRCSRCQKERTDEVKLSRCGSCQKAKYCSRTCQSKNWKKHKQSCAHLKHRLESPAWVKRDRSGAKVLNPDILVRGEVDVKSLPRDEDGEYVSEHRYFRLPKELGGKKVELSKCAMAHRDVLDSLTLDQLKALYPLACIERWGTSFEPVHEGATGEPNMVPLWKLLAATEEACNSCGADGEQYFCFCMNRALNDDRCYYCATCRRCFYFRPGCLKRCAYKDCNAKQHYTESPDEPDSDESESSRQFEAGMAAEGYWGY